MENESKDVAILKNLIESELANALNWSQESGLWRLFKPLVSRASQRFAEIGIDFDQYVGENGFDKAAQAFLPKFTQQFEVIGKDHVPDSGPLLVVSNHPGAIDSLIIPASLARPDIKLVAGEIPFLQHLPRLCEHIIYTSKKDLASRANVVRSGVRHLNNGGSLLIYPSGRIDPDPAFMPEAMEEIDSWSRSVEIFLHRAPGTQVLVTIVSGVLASKYFRHPLTWLRKKRMDRQRIAEMLQTIQQLLKDKMPPIKPQVTIGIPFELPQNDNLNAMQMIVDYAKQLLTSHWQITTSHVNEYPSNL